VVSSTAFIPPVLDHPSWTNLSLIFPSGSLIRYILNPNVYLIENGAKRLIPDYQNFIKLTSNDPKKLIVVTNSTFINAFR
jgi:hypothetical protein